MTPEKRMTLFVLEEATTTVTASQAQLTPWKPVYRDGHPISSIRRDAIEDWLASLEPLQLQAAKSGNCPFGIGMKSYRIAEYTRGDD